VEPALVDAEVELPVEVELDEVPAEVVPELLLELLPLPEQPAANARAPRSNAKRFILYS